jgi:hypothetical protein
MRETVTSPSILRIKVVICMTLQDVRARQPHWFSAANMRFFNDVSYRLHVGASGQYWLVRLTGMWSDMFGGKLRYCYRINKVSDKGAIGELVTEQFRDMDDVQDWLKDH